MCVNLSMPLINKSLCENQYSFLFSNFIYKNFSNRLQTDAIFIDFVKASDKVDHPPLLAKLHILAIKSTILNWISSYL